MNSRLDHKITDTLTFNILLILKYQSFVNDAILCLCTSFIDYFIHCEIQFLFLRKRETKRDVRSLRLQT